MMTHNRTLASALLIALALLAALAAPAQRAAAGGGNVQIRLYSTSGVAITRAEVGGYNQYNSYAVWGPYYTSSTEVKTTGWWFGGNGSAAYVNLRIHLANGSATSCLQGISTYPWEDWKTIDVDASGWTTSWLAPSGRCAAITGF